MISAERKQQKGAMSYFPLTVVKFSEWDPDSTDIEVHDDRGRWQGQVAGKEVWRRGAGGKRRKLPKSGQQGESALGNC